MRLGSILLASSILLSASAASADDRLNSHPWSYRVRGGAVALTRAMAMWQVKKTEEASGAAASAINATGSGGLAGLPSIGSIANLNIVTVVVGEGGTADVAVEAEQQNSGPIDATGVTAQTGVLNLNGASVGSAAIPRP